MEFIKIFFRDKCLLSKLIRKIFSKETSLKVEEVVKDEVCDAIEEISPKKRGRPKKVK